MRGGNLEGSKRFLPKGKDDTSIFKSDYMIQGSNADHVSGTRYGNKTNKQKKTYPPCLRLNTELIRGLVNQWQCLPRSSDRTRVDSDVWLKKAKVLWKR